MPEKIDADPSFVALIDGRPANATDLSQLSFAGYAHFTAMQVRQGKVRGLDLHLERLRTASTELFGHAHEEEEVRRLLRAAIGKNAPDLSLTATAFPSMGEFTDGATRCKPSMLIRTSPASSGPEGPFALAVVEHERFLPHIKHTGEAAKTFYLRHATQTGFDDFVLQDSDGRLSEGSIWNLAFWDGDAVIWPEAKMLVGTTQNIVRRQLETRGVPQRTDPVTVTDLYNMKGAVIMNSWTPALAVNRIGDAHLPEAPGFYDLLHDAFDSEPASAP